MPFDRLRREWEARERPAREAQAAYVREMLLAAERREREKAIQHANSSGIEQLIYDLIKAVGHGSLQKEVMEHEYCFYELDFSDVTWEQRVQIRVNGDGTIWFYGAEYRSVTYEQWRNNPQILERELEYAYDNPIKNRKEVESTRPNIPYGAD